MIPADGGPYTSIKLAVRSPVDVLIVCRGLGDNTLQAALHSYAFMSSSHAGCRAEATRPMDLA